jgi:GNAT superfamily N-acetyltransferase
MNDLRIQTMEPRHIKAAMTIGRLEGWDQTEADWRRLITLEPEGCFLAEWEGAPAGTVTTLRHGASHAWIGMVRVDPACRRRGIAGALTRHAVDHLQRLNIATIKLDATDAGRGVYRELGFEDEVGLVRCAARLRSPDESELGQAAVPMREADLGAVVSFDRPSFGADRGELLESLWRDNPKRCFCCRTPTGDVQGFIMARPGARSWYLGPWVASTCGAAARLLHRALAQVGPEQDVLIDIGAGCPEAAILLASLGFVSTRTCTRMVLGANTTPGVPERIYGLSGFETG